MISVTLSKLNPDTPLYNTYTPGIERSVLSSDEIDARVSHFIRDRAWLKARAIARAGLALYL